MDRNAWTKALWLAQRTKQITPYFYLVGRCLLKHANKAGRCWPSKLTIAEDLGCSERTVGRATAALRALGLITWTQRADGWNKRSSNLYGLSMPKKEKLKMPLASSAATLSVGSDAPLPDALAGALRRLAVAIGCSAEALPGWLTAPESGPTGSTPAGPSPCAC